MMVVSSTAVTKTSYPIVCSLARNHFFTTVQINTTLLDLPMNKSEETYNVCILRRES
jgi:hypothetical protein